MINIHSKLLSKVDDSEMWLLIHIANRIGMEMKCFPSNKTLMRDTGWKIDKLQRVKKSLAEKGLIEITERVNSSNLYTINTDLISLFVPAKGRSTEEGKYTVKTSIPKKEPTVFFQGEDTGKTNNEVLPSEVLVPSTNVDGTEVKSSEFDEGIESQNINSDGGGDPESEDAFKARKQRFERNVKDVGGLIYTKRMLDKFISHWSQPNGAKKPRMRWETEREKKGWSTIHRLRTWSENKYDSFPYFLTEEEKTIEAKKRSFIGLLKNFRVTYTREMLNDFYRHWTMPENVQDPKRLRWELEDFWDLSTRLSQWNEREKEKQRQR